MTLDDWSIEPGRLGDFPLGMPREEALRRLRELGAELNDVDVADPEDGEEDWIYADDFDLELHFAEVGDRPLLEILCCDDRLTIGTASVIGQRVHEIVDRLRISDLATLWTSDETGDPGAAKERFDVLQNPNDEDLLKTGTLWIPAQGLAFTMWYGEVSSVRIRPPSASPAQGAGPLTPSQRELSARGDLKDALTPTTISTHSSPVAVWFRRLWTLAFLGALGLVGWKAFDYHQRWRTAEVAEGTVVAVRPAPPEPFPDEFDVAYRDASGAERQVTLVRNDVYVTAATGEKIELRYLAEAPDKPMGPARYRDADFVEFAPLGMSVFAVYLLGQFFIWPFAALFSWAMSGAASGASRPEEEYKSSIGKQYD